MITYPIRQIRARSLDLVVDRVGLRIDVGSTEIEVSCNSITRLGCERGSAYPKSARSPTEMVLVDWSPQGLFRFDGVNSRSTGAARSGATLLRYLLSNGHT